MFYNFKKIIKPIRLQKMVQLAGFEPARVAPLESESSTSTSSITAALLNDITKDKISKLLLR